MTARRLPNRTAHETLAMQRMAVRSDEHWQFRPEQQVMTSDGFLGRVTAVTDGPVPGREDYHVELQGGFGGGSYTASQLSVPPGVVASSGTAAQDYPELAQILVSKPDPALIRHLAKTSDDSGGGKPWEKDDSGKDDDEDDGAKGDGAKGDDSDKDDDSDDSDKGDDSENPFSKFTSLIVAAATNDSFRFHITSAWRDVVAKAKRIRAEGGVRVTLATDGMVVGEVKGDTEVYESGLQRLPGRTAVQAWSCGCKWGAYHWGADDDLSRFAGRMCSHALALTYEAQSRGMFGRDVGADSEKPSWVPRQVVVKYDIDDRRNDLARSSTLQPPADSPLRRAASRVLSTGADYDEVVLAMAAAGIRVKPRTAAVNSPFGEPGGDIVNQSAPRMPGATSPRVLDENPASAGSLVAGDPAGWGQALPGTLDDRLGSWSSEASLFEPGSAEAVVHDNPQPALPSTDGDSAIPQDDEALSPSTAMRKRALKDFSPSERRELINEGEEGVRARNLDGLQIEGTHYAALEEALAAEGGVDLFG